MTVLQVAIGGALGAVLRYALGLALRFPYATFCVNVLGSLVMGVVMVWLLESSGFDRWQPLVMTGLLGGFTTFSAFSLDTLRLYEAGQIAGAAIYVAGSVFLSLLAVFIGVALGRAML